MADPFATPEDVAARWRELTGPEEARAEVLLGDASRIVRRRWPDIDARITAGTVDADDVRMIVAGMVKRAMLGPDVRRRHRAVRERRTVRGEPAVRQPAGEPLTCPPRTSRSSTRGSPPGAGSEPSSST
jgi:hypothetical protein